MLQPRHHIPHSHCPLHFVSHECAFSLSNTRRAQLHNAKLALTWAHTHTHTHTHTHKYITRRWKRLRREEGKWERDRAPGRWEGESGRKGEKTREKENTNRTALCNSSHPYACMHIKTLTLFTLHQTHRLTHALILSFSFSLTLSLSYTHTHKGARLHTHTHPVHLIAAGCRRVENRVAVSFALLSRNRQMCNCTTLTIMNAVLNVKHILSLPGSNSVHAGHLMSESMNTNK